MSDSPAIYVDNPAINAVTGQLEAAANRLSQAGRQFQENASVTFYPGDAYSDALESFFPSAVKSISDVADGLGGTVGGVNSAIKTTQDAYNSADQAAAE